MAKSSFGERLRKAFGGAKQVEIARKMGVSESAVKNYVSGRVPDADKLLQIKNLTNCDLDWLLTGNEPQNVSGLQIRPALLDRLKAIATEQAHALYSDLDIGGNNIEERTLQFLTEFLIYRSLLLYHLAEPGDLMAKTELERARRFTFAENASGTIDDRIREIIHREGRLGLGAEDELRDMIRAIIQEEVGPKVPVYTLDLGDKKTRKTG